MNKEDYIAEKLFFIKSVEVPMIKSFLFLCLLFVSTLAYSQQDGDAAYSFGVRGYTRQAIPKILNPESGRRYITTYFNSYMVKFNDNLFSYRLNGNYSNQSINYGNECVGCTVGTGKVKDYAFKAGFEKNFIYGKVQPYLGFDIGYRSDEFNGVVSAENSQSNNLFRKRGFTLSPVLGLKVSPVKAISIFAEANMEYFYSWGKESVTTSSEVITTTHRRFDKGEYLYNPVSVGIQIHVGSKRKM